MHYPIHGRQMLASQNSLRAGVAKRDITTADPGACIHDRLYAKALALDDGQTRVVIVSMDAVAIGGICDVADSFLPRLRGRIERELGVPGAHVLVHATHTHPPGRLLCDDEEQASRTFDAVRSALENLRPAKVGSGRGREDRIAINRTLRLKDGRQWTIRHSNPCPPDELVESLGPLDPEIGVLRVDDVDRRPIAVVYNFACHPLLGVPGCAVTGNFPAFASRVIEQTLGGETMAFFLLGAAGDVTEVLYKEANRPRDSEPVGTTLGVSTLAVLPGIRTGGATLSVVSETIELPRRTDIPRRREALLKEQGELLASLRFTSLNIKTFIPLYIRYALDPEHPADYGYRYLHERAIGVDHLRAMDAETRSFMEKYLANIRAMERLAHIQDDLGTLARHEAINAESGSDTVSAEVQGIRIGDCALIAAPIELLTQIGLNVKAASPFPFTFVLGFSNGYLHYGPPAEDYGKGGYETTECLLAPEWQEVFEQTAQRILQQLWDQPASAPTSSTLPAMVAAGAGAADHRVRNPSR